MSAVKHALARHPSSHPSQGVLAANIFDWGAKACVDLYQSATILEMYREVGGSRWGLPARAAMYMKEGPCVWERWRCSGSAMADENCPGPRSPLQARTRLSQRPWRVDDFDAFAEVWGSTVCWRTVRQIADCVCGPCKLQWSHALQSYVPPGFACLPCRCGSARASWTQMARVSKPPRSGSDPHVNALGTPRLP